ncbi:MAG: hypothetical protein R3320_03220 [Nitriliruptorales bacterium]|nr:hypothetical protein [Nitriliruptorales bacterium]
MVFLAVFLAAVAIEVYRRARHSSTARTLRPLVVFLLIAAAFGLLISGVVPLWLGLTTWVAVVVLAAYIGYRPQLRAGRLEAFRTAVAEVLEPASELPDPLRSWADEHGDWREVAAVHRSQGTRRTLTAFDLRWGTASHNDTSERTSVEGVWTVCAATLPSSLPDLTVRREWSISEVARLLTIRDQQLESDRFNRRYDVTTDDDRMTTGVLTPPMMTWLLDQPDDVGLAIRGDQLIVWQQRAATRAEVRAAIDRAVRGTELIGSHVDDLTGDET